MPHSINAIPAKPLNWANVPGVTYPVRAIWASVPGVQFPDPKAPRVQTPQEREKSRRRREKTVAARREVIAANAAEKAERIARLIALYDAGKTVAQSAAEIRMCPVRASSHLRKAGRVVYRGRSPKPRQGIIYAETKRRQHAEWKETGARMRATREKANVSMKKLARLMGISAPFLLAMEHGSRNYTPARQESAIAAIEKFRASTQSFS